MAGLVRGRIRLTGLAYEEDCLVEEKDEEESLDWLKRKKKTGLT